MKLLFFSGTPSKGTVFDTLHRRDAYPVQKHPLTCIPEEDIQIIGQNGMVQQTPDTYIAKEKRAAQIRLTATGSEQNKVPEESPQSNGQSVRDIVKLFESLNSEKEMKKQKSAVPFVHRVMEQKSVKLTVR